MKGKWCFQMKNNNALVGDTVDGRNPGAVEVFKAL